MAPDLGYNCGRNPGGHFVFQLRTKAASKTRVHPNTTGPESDFGGFVATRSFAAVYAERED